MKCLNQKKGTILLLIFNIIYASGFSLAPVLGLSQYQTFEFRCTIAFNDPSIGVRSYVTTTLIAVLLVPFGQCVICYSLIVWTYYTSRIHLQSTQHDNNESEARNSSSLIVVDKKLNLMCSLPLLLATSWLGHHLPVSVFGR